MTLDRELPSRATGAGTRRAFSVAIYARRGGRVLVIHHRRLDTWLPVGGELEAGETPLEAARRELVEETGLTGRFEPLAGAADGEPPGFLGYEEHVAGAKGLHMNFVFVADVGAEDAVAPNHEFAAFRWVDADELAALVSPLNVREFGFRALAARPRPR
jgi:8-oxo-dGTP pyrophosphatase MutT (NUDIX family)